MASKSKPTPPGGDKGKKARDADDAKLSKAHKSDNVGGSMRALGRIIRGGGKK